MRKHLSENPHQIMLFLLALLPFGVLLVFIHSYSINAPFADQWGQSLKIAFAIQRGELPLELVWESGNGHRMVLTHLQTVVSSLLDHWNPKAEAYVTPLWVLLNAVLILRLFHQQSPQLTAWYAPIVTFLLCSLYANDLWLFSWNSAWQIVFAGFLSTLSLLYLRPITPIWLLIAILLAIGTSFSFGPGLLVWVIMPIVLWGKGYRYWPGYLAWGGVAVFTIWLYFMGGTSENQFRDLTLENAWPILIFMLRMLGSALSVSGYESTWPALAGGLGLGMAGLNLFRLWRSTHQVDRLLPWLSLLGYALGMTVMITLTRFSASDPTIALAGRYSYSSLVLWVVVAALMLLNSHDKSILPFNMLVGVILMGAFLNSNLAMMSILGHNTNRYLLYHQTSSHPSEVCVRNLPRYQDAACLDDFLINGGGTADQVYQLAAYRSALFSDDPIHQLLPATYQNGQPIVIQTQSAWLNIFVRDSLLNFLPESQVIHIAPEPEDAIPFPNPYPEPLLATLEAEGIAALLADQPSIWHLFSTQTADEAVALQGLLPDYYPTPVPIFDAIYRDSQFTLLRYDLAPALSEQYRFGEHLSLQGFEVSSYELTPCQPLVVKTWWLLSDYLSTPHGSTIALVQGDAVYQTDADLANLPFEFWEVKRPYLDERIVPIPCDAPSGRYDVLVGVYQREPLTDLVLTLPANSGNRAYLTTITRQ